jgi:hypothetical protein
MATQSEEVAPVNVRNRIGRVAQELGVEDPTSGELGDLFAQTFSNPGPHAPYTSNCLQPGAWPLEWSFSEGEPDALRLEIQPFDPALDGNERLRRTITALLPSIEKHHGGIAALQFESAVKTAMAVHSKLKYGVFVGLVERPGQSRKFKIYVECDPQDRSLFFEEVSSIGGIRPHFLSIAAERDSVTTRAYYVCRHGLRALDLERACDELGIAHRFPELLISLLELTDGEFYLSPNSVLLGVRRQAQETELKVELICGAEINGGELVDRIRRLLQPGSVAHFSRWVSTICLGNEESMPIRVVSIKTSTHHPRQLSVYAAESWSEC